jgi:hypothetical protein
MKEDTMEEAEAFKTGVMMLAELLLASLKVGVEVGFKDGVPVEDMKKFIKIYSVTLCDGKLGFEDIKATIKESALIAKQDVEDKPGKVVH